MVYFIYYVSLVQTIFIVYANGVPIFFGFYLLCSTCVFYYTMKKKINKCKRNEEENFINTIVNFVWIQINKDKCWNFLFDGWIMLLMLMRLLL